MRKHKSYLIPDAIGRYEGKRYTPANTAEFWGYLYGTEGPVEPCDLFTKYQLVRAINGAIEQAAIVADELEPKSGVGDIIRKATITKEKE